MIGVLLKDGNLSMVEAEIPQALAGEALLRVLQVGVCNTDIELARGYVQSDSPHSISFLYFEILRRQL